MKTTLEIPDDLLTEAKKRAADQRRSLRDLVTNFSDRDAMHDAPRLVQPLR